MSDDPIAEEYIYSNITESEKLQLEEEESKSWTSYISKGVIILKFIAVTTMLT